MADRRGARIPVAGAPGEKDDSATPEERAALRVLLDNPDRTIRDLDLDALADGIVAHRNGLAFHESPYSSASSVAGFSWRIGWNERALKSR
jgi:hypothetical protein